MSELMPSGVPYNGPIDAMVDSVFFTSADLPRGTRKVYTVEKVTERGGVLLRGKPSGKTIWLKFAENPKELLIKATNRDALDRIFPDLRGKSAQGLIGRRVYLYVDERVQNPNGGAPICGVRIWYELPPSKETTA